MPWLIDGKQDKLRQLKDKLAVKGDSKITYRAVDVGKYEDVDAAVSSSIQEMGDIDILINNVSSPLQPQLRGTRR